MFGTAIPACVFLLSLFLCVLGGYSKTALMEVIAMIFEVLMNKVRFKAQYCRWHATCPREGCVHHLRNALDATEGVEMCNFQYYVINGPLLIAFHRAVAWNAGTRFFNDDEIPHIRTGHALLGRCNDRRFGFECMRTTKSIYVPDKVPSAPWTVNISLAQSFPVLHVLGNSDRNALFCAHERSGFPRVV